MRYFNQLQWTVMGTKLAAPYVILFMGYLEDKTWNSFVEKLLIGGGTFIIFS